MKVVEVTATRQRERRVKEQPVRLTEGEEVTKQPSVRDIVKI